MLKEQNLFSIMSSFVFIFYIECRIGGFINVILFLIHLLSYVLEYSKLTFKSFSCFKNQIAAILYFLVVESCLKAKHLFYPPT